MGHYMVFNGYDDAGQFLVAQDSLAGPNQEYPYETLQTDWRAFNYVYMVIYPPDKEADVMRILGPQADEKANYEYAALKASNEVMGLSGREKFFALYNRGTNLVELQDYGGAAQIYDEAFLYYESDIPEADRPYRALWYQTGPYKAYYYTGRYWNVINLATVTLDTMIKATAEESFYWRAMAELALGDTAGAYKDVQQALKFHEGFEPAIQLLTEMGY
jgi:tetratricopeptide (TPR) repeat protein